MSSMGNCLKLNSFWNNQTFIILLLRSVSVWPWTKVMVNIINMWCILMYSEAVTVPSLTMMTSTVSEKSLARDTHTQMTKTLDTMRETWACLLLVLVLVLTFPQSKTKEKKNKVHHKPAAADHSHPARIAGSYQARLRSGRSLLPDLYCPAHLGDMLCLPDPN